MLKKLSISTCLGLSLLAQGTLADAQETGPVRDGLRHTGQAAAEGTRAAVQGTRNAINRAGEATRNAIDNTSEAARAQVDRAQRNELPVNANSRVDANANLDADLNNSGQLDANGQIQGQINDDRYESGFRGVDDQGNSIDQGQASHSFERGSQVEHHGRTYAVRHSRDGRAFICVGGCPVYLDQQSGGAQQHEAYRMNSDHMQKNGTHQPTPADHNNQEYREDNLQGGTNAPAREYGGAPAPPAPVRADVDAAAPANPSLNSDTQVNAEQSRDLSASADVDSDADADSSARISGATDADASASASTSDSDAEVSPSTSDEKSPAETDNDSSSE